MSAPSADAIKAKLSAIDATQETIVSIAQWVMFYKRNAAQIVDIWHQCVRDASSNRKLNLIYLANEVAQTSRAKKRSEYPDAFSKVMPEALEHVYRQSTTSIQEKLKRVVDVWQQRSIFAPQVVDAIMQRLQGRQKAPVKAKAEAHALPTELDGLLQIFGRITSASAAIQAPIDTIKQSYESTMSPDAVSANPDTLQQKLLQLLNAIESSKTGVTDLLSFRQMVSSELQTLMAVNEQQITKLSSQLEALAKQSTAVSARLEENRSATDFMPDQRSTTPEMDPPQAEALTPPPDEEFDLDRIMKQISGAQSTQATAASNDPVSNMDLDESVLELASKGQNETEASGAPAEEEYNP